MNKHQKTWSLAEKLEAVRLLKAEGVSKASRQSGVSSTTLYKWESRFDQHGEQGLIQNQNHQKDPELEKLKRENHALKMLVAEKELVIRVQSELLKKSP
ncbi:MAG: helix-turn-helix domain-containing protein [Bacteroidetes bacterium]|nr:helix-turn-helix domain-containing protein [Bacteroidota bacterium]